MASFDAATPLEEWRPVPPVKTAWSAFVRHVAPALSRAALVSLFALFAWSNYSHWRATGQPAGLGTTLLEGWVAALFLVRRPTRDISLRPVAWIAAPIGSFAMLLARPEGGGLAQLPCEALQLAGLAIALVSLATLGRSFGLVAANRGVKTRGLYGVVRHPTYAGYLLTYVGYVLENPSVRNVVLLCLGTAFQLVRINEEERVLGADAHYGEYRQSVRYRLIPLVY
jgi:protein-S-isoprenylcysteine O-methyltransferase Ste14